MRKILSLLMISLMAVFNLSAKTLYLAPNDGWKSGGARFAVYAFGSGDAWYSMTAVEGEDGLYQAAVDDKYTTVIFCRMNGSAAENNWNNKYNQTQDMAIENDKNLCNISGWDNAGAWGVYTPAGSGEQAEMDTIYVYDGTHSTTAAVVAGGTAEVVGATSNIIGKAEKGNWSIVLGKGLSSSGGPHYIRIDLAQALKAGDKIVLGMHRSAKVDATPASATFGMDFNATTTDMTANGQVLIVDPQVLTATGVPTDTTFTVPAEAVGMTHIRLYRNAGSTSIFVPKFVILREKSGEQPEDPEQPEEVDSTTVYFYNNLGWANVNAFVWPATGTAYKEWPGEAAKKEAEQIYGKDVYAYTFPESYVNVIFNNGTAQTKDLAWNAAKPYFVPGAADGEGKFEGEWMAKAEIPAPEVSAKYYITGIGGWNEKQVKSEADVYVFEGLKADTVYTFKVLPEGLWEGGTILGYDELSEKPAGVYADNDKNVCFKLSEAGDVTITYKAAAEEEPMVFTVEGNFYVKPVVKKDLQLVPGVWSEAGAKMAAWIWGAELESQWTAFFAPKSENNDTLKAEINADADSIIFVRFKPEATEPKWDGGEGYIWNRLADDSIQYESLIYTITGWGEGQGEGTWDPYIAPEPPVLEDGYYLIGLTGWDINALNASLKLELNTAAAEGAEEYMIGAALAEGNEFKIVSVANDAIVTWYPGDGMPNYTVDANHAGQKTIYFRPEGGMEGWHQGYIWVDSNETTGMINTEAENVVVKQLYNGQVIIRRGERVYTVMGQLIK